jgi:hypothetical protein
MPGVYVVRDADGQALAYVYTVAMLLVLIGGHFGDRKDYHRLFAVCE